MSVELLGINDPRWSEHLGRLPHDLYHRPEYLRIEARRLNATAEAFTVQDGDRLFFVPYLVRSCASLFPDVSTDALDVISPYGYPGMLVSEAGRDSSFTRDAVSILREELSRRGVCSAFFRLHPMLCDYLPTLLPSHMIQNHGDTVAIDLSLDVTTLTRQIRRTNQKRIMKCRQLGFTARFVPLAEVLDEFQLVYRETMDRVNANATYYFDQEYFAELSKLENVHCCVIERSGTLAAACLFFETNGIVQAHLGATRTEFMSNSPFDMAFYEGMLWGKQRGNRWLHLGGGVGGLNDALLYYKTGFSPSRFQYSTMRLIIHETAYMKLVRLQGRALKVPVETLLSEPFFPAYRQCTVQTQ